MNTQLITCPEQDIPRKNFCFVWDASNQVIGHIYRDCGLNDMYCFAPFSHGLASVIHGVTLERAAEVLEAFQLRTAEGGLEVL